MRHSLGNLSFLFIEIGYDEILLSYRFRTFRMGRELGFLASISMGKRYLMSCKSLICTGLCLEMMGLKLGPGIPGPCAGRTNMFH